MSLRELAFLYRHKRACRRLAKMVERNRNSFETEQFRRRREAMLKHTRAMPSARAFVLRTAPKVAALRASIAIAIQREEK